MGLPPNFSALDNISLKSPHRNQEALCLYAKYSRFFHKVFLDIYEVLAYTKEISQGWYQNRSMQLLSNDGNGINS